MKSFIILIILLSAITGTGFSQETTSPNQPLTRQDYLKKSKTQKILGFVFLGVGVGCIALVSSGESSFGTTAAVGVAGGVIALSSIPLFIASGRNKRKAMAATAGLNLEKVLDNQIVFKHAGNFPALAIRLNL
jgi:ABC-type transport system involved in multi-copper enzyme maturation permease subunit